MRGAFGKRFRRSLRALIVLGAAFATGWTIQSWVNPQLLMRDLWAKSQHAQRPLAPRPPGSRVGAAAIGVRAAGLTAGTAAAFSLEELLAIRDPIGGLQRLSEHLKGSDLAEIMRLFPELVRIAHPDVRREALGDLFGRWAEFDPRGALSAAESLKDKGKGYLSDIWRRWAATDIEAAMAEAKATGQWEGHRSALIRGLAESNPLMALQRWKEFGGTSNDYSFFYSLAPALRRAAAAEPLKALAAMADMPASVIQNMGLNSSLLDPWIEKDGSGALREIQGLTDTALRDRLLPDALRLYATRDAEAASKIVRDLPAGAQRTSLAQSVAEGKAQTDPVAALKLYRELVGEDPTSGLDWLVNRTEKLTAAQATALLAEIPLGSARDSLIAAMLRQLGGDGNTEGRAWLASQPVATLDPAAVIRAGRLLPQSEWSPYLDRLSTLPGAMRNEGFANFGRVAAETIAKDTGLSPQERAQRVGQLDPRLQAAAARSVFAQIGIPTDATETRIYGDPSGEEVRRSYRLVNGRMEELRPDATQSRTFFDSLPDTTQRETALYFAAQTATASPAEAAGVLGRYPAASDDPAAALLYESVAKRWMRQDSLEASEWIGQLPAGAVRDATVVALIESTARDDADAAQQWAATLTDPVAQLRAANALAAAGEKPEIRNPKSETNSNER